ncbi:type I-E CRISPR-associated protein Cas7/Cse4/CasC [Corynebacterium pseudodiphtheriticum]|jgi:CRISPR system CASCADE complex protein casC|uniref:Type I-E CRISPR-associated protein Cas7/Cse4/CasC n=1 Tax=Corynebacterium pseudodiphtheriticum TaxID=37637 RepID=A0ABT7FZB2_9CORY|nr:type I-E CRISPR-associated protein Cas7/Cse4/CasC [Corynebacterium pseudodiphtheriticum]MDK4207471.1 type I-E CRISPR-associated protein Cas7/Cse4/CasC [Corynebacterium pseudodiphtheriticum]MDK4278600.1 type I-E CRISPR-associated protein Cas7/Cse4/CasC [Corynebacterium pseudodiphtheriticum]MDK4290817.1 type I-E CRISPR-associated protein Cas7/Cse4/CasC [Corynebacterium pseudodiphtheriticum]MDK8806288.1 type I-E CRISPR-associated protein Cas7/Cse4/CasC [Corynebacterium pseudodiphtheriticum]RUP
MSLIVDTHALQTIPPSLINRDDTGAPKSAVFGGTPRQRVSSQSWKRAIRKFFEDNFDPEQIGDRSKRLPEKIARKLEDAGLEQAEAISRTEQLFKAAKIKTSVQKLSKKDIENGVEANPYPETGYLLFLSQHQIDRAVSELLERDGENLKKNEAQEILDTGHSVDMSMFGRMVADDAAYNVDASVQVAHALGIHASAPEFDFFTAVDDLAEEGEETGAGMLGTVQMMSSTLYRYATVNVDSLAENLDSRENAFQATEQFIDAFIKSMPTGKINTFANQTLPELVYITVRDSRPISLVNAFESPVEATESASRREVGAQKLAEEAHNIESIYGFTPRAAFVLGIGELTKPFQNLAETITLPDLKNKISDELRRAAGE